MYYQFLSSRNAISNLERTMIKVSTIKPAGDVVRNNAPDMG